MIYQFRVWDKVEKSMIYDFQIGSEIAWTTLNDTFASDKFVFLRKLGHKDKNEKEMYEGDIVKTWDNTGSPCFGGQTTVLSYHTYFTIPAYIEVIGNEFDNPELVQLKARP